jgi:chromosome segregation ATPase
MPQEAVTHIERLLVAIDRLRDERDNLQRDMHFLESESKFAVDALNAKLAASSTSNLAEGSKSGEAFIQMQTEIGALRGQLATAAMQLSEAILTKDKHIERLVLAATASAVAIEHLQSQLDHLERRFIDAYSARADVEENLQNSQRCMEGMEERLEELEVKLEVTSLCLQATTRQRNDAIMQLEAGDDERDSEIRKVKRELLETRDTLEEAEIRYASVSKALEDMESERNSLALQIMNLSTDLRIAQEDLANAENRYSILQSHQLSSMSSNEAAHVLRDQIQELEMRVMRRTEQIGIHQHDIKRLETNLRLQEERLGEMTIELEMMAAQKDAMVEDCADARGTRDEALARLDQLEIDMETRAEESDDVAAALVAVIFGTISHSRDTSRQSIESASKAEQEICRLNTARQQILDQNLMLLDSLRCSDEKVQQSPFAQAALQSARACIYSMQGDGDRLDIQQEKLAECTEAVSRSKELEALESQATEEVVEFSVRASELETQVVVLQNGFLIAEAKHHAAIDELVRSRELLQKSLDEARRASLGSSNLEDGLACIEARYAEELEGVQFRLLETSNELRDLQARHTSAEAEHHQALSEASKTKQELEQHLAEASETLQQRLQEQQEADQEASAEITRLRTGLDVALADAQTAQDCREELQILYDRVLDELAELRQNHEVSLAGIADRSLAIRQELDDRLAELQSRFDGQSMELDNAVQETTQLTQKLQDALEQLSTIEETHQKELHSVDQQRHSAKSALIEHQREMSITKSQIEQLKTTVQTVQAEKLSLQEELTTLAAECQRSSSLRHFLESQEQDRSVTSFLIACHAHNPDVADGRSNH